MEKGNGPVTAGAGLWGVHSSSDAARTECADASDFMRALSRPNIAAHKDAAPCTRLGAHWPRRCFPLLLWRRGAGRGGTVRERHSCSWRPSLFRFAGRGEAFCPASFPASRLVAERNDCFPPFSSPAGSPCGAAVHARSPTKHPPDCCATGDSRSADPQCPRLPGIDLAPRHAPAAEATRVQNRPAQWPAEPQDNRSQESIRRADAGVGI